MNKFASLARGAARVVDLFGTMSRFTTYSLSQNSDYYAIKHDWQTVGQDMKGAIKDYERHTPSRQKISRAK